VLAPKAKHDCPATRNTLTMEAPKFAAKVCNTPNYIDLFSFWENPI
jgi:hypothetical protein